MQILSLTQCLVPALGAFLHDHHSTDSNRFFSPHGSDAETLTHIAQNVRKDVYLLGMLDGEVLVYGLLRGWDEGFEIPSLGIAVAPKVRGLGLGRAMMLWLHASAAVRGARKIRLRVLSSNLKAHHLYVSLGYVFDEDGNTPNYLVGYFNLKEFQ